MLFLFLLIVFCGFMYVRYEWAMLDGQARRDSDRPLASWRKRRNVSRLSPLQRQMLGGCRRNVPVIRVKRHQGRA